MPHDLDDTPFSYTASKNGRVLLHAQGKLVKALKGAAAQRFLDQLQGLDVLEAQRLMAKTTGQFKFGNERPHQKPGA
ncbi:MAG: hypothetical protein AAGI15_02590 [Pseudomonadota bacterium]